MTFDPRTRSPTLRALLKTRLAPVREKELLAKAQDPEKPVKPAAGDCCGSSCKPCVMDLYREELKVWKECWVSSTDAVDEVKSRPEKEAENKYKIPGSFDW